jgi:hypothetical protein
MMKRTTALLTLALLIICGLMISSPRVTGQSGRDSISPNAVFDPCIPISPLCQPATPPDPRKGVSMGVILRQDDLDKQVQDLRGPSRAFYPAAKLNIEILKESRTGWVRLWADWPTLQPTHDFSFDNIYVDGRTQPYIENLDAQIVFARQKNLKVILVVHHRFPLWANGVPDSVCASGCEAETDEDRKQQCERRCREINDPNWSRLKLMEPRDSYGRVPADLGKDSPWGKWIGFLVRQYGYSNTTKATLRYVDYLEVVNEPNNRTMWPQWRDDKVGNRDNIKDRLVIANSVAQMFQTAQEIVSLRNAEPGVADAQHPTTIKLAGPAALDLRDPWPDEPGDTQAKKDSRKRQRTLKTGYDTFSRELLVQLRKLPFNPKSYFAWSHHNYGDVEIERGESPVFDPKAQALKDPTGRTNAAAWVRELLRVGTGRGRANRWTGWPDSDHPGLLITEGGARLSAVVSQAEQARLVGNNFNLMLDDGGRLRAGIGLFTQYLTYSDICFDTGLFHFIDPQPTQKRDIDCAKKHGFTGGDGLPRMVYDRWKTLTSTSKNPSP